MELHVQYYCTKCEAPTRYAVETHDDKQFLICMICGAVTTVCDHCDGDGHIYWIDNEGCRCVARCDTCGGLGLIDAGTWEGHEPPDGGK
jgi:hypothetical protein